jgi:hypothetical protein
VLHRNFRTHFYRLHTHTALLFTHPSPHAQLAHLNILLLPAALSDEASPAGFASASPEKKVKA